jgi:methyl-accepting chemotaxis protein
MALFISQQISKRVRLLVASMKKAASGNLTDENVKFKSRDEIRELGDVFNQMVGDLRSVVSQVSHSSS